ncbi:MAG TPA: HAD family hydrolase [Cellvibrionales bacterium]|nr:HAD family hydrolase [Cellvibrionales bacterium]
MSWDIIVLFIFDWDGTLADSREQIVESMQATIEGLNWPVRTDQQCADMIGLGLQQTAEALYPAKAASDYQTFATHYSAHYGRLKDKHGATRFFPNALQTLADLKSRGHTLAVATGKSRRGLDRLLVSDGLEAMFVASRTADQTASKPDPMMLQQLLDETGTSLADAVMVGDTSYDLEMAQRIGMASIGVDWGMHSTACLAAFAPVIIISSFDQLVFWASDQEKRRADGGKP